MDTRYAHLLDIKNSTARGVRFSSQLKALVSQASGVRGLSADRFIREAVIQSLISQGILDEVAA